MYSDSRASEASRTEQHQPAEWKRLPTNSPLWLSKLLCLIFLLQSFQCGSFCLTADTLSASVMRCHHRADKAWWCNVSESWGGSDVTSLIFVILQPSLLFLSLCPGYATDFVEPLSNLAQFLILLFMNYIIWAKRLKIAFRGREKYWDADRQQRKLLWHDKVLCGKSVWCVDVKHD